MSGRKKTVRPRPRETSESFTFEGGTFTRVGRQIVFEASDDPDARERAAQQFVDANRLDLQQQLQRQASLVKLLEEVGPFDVVARASALYLAIDPETFRESEADNNPAHIEFLALQTLTCSTAATREPYAPIQRYAATIEAVNIVREMFEVEKRAIVAQEIEQAWADPGQLRTGHSFRSKLGALSVRNTAYSHHAEQILIECFAPLSPRMRELLGFDAATAVELLKVVPTVVDGRVEPLHAQIATETAESIKQLKRARRGKATTVAVPDELLKMPYRDAEQLIRQFALARLFDAAEAIFTVTPRQLAEASGASEAACLAFLEALTCPRSAFVPEHHKRPTGAHPLTYRPVLKTSTGYLFSNFNSAIEVLRPALEDVIKDRDPQLWQTYLRQRGKYLENTATALLQDALPGSVASTSISWRSPNGLEGELDGIVSCDVLTLRLQCKAGRVSESARRGAPGRMRTDLGKVIKDAADQHASLAQQLRAHSTRNLGFPVAQAVALEQPLQLEVIVCLDDVTAWSTEAHELRALGVFEGNVGVPWVVSLADLMVVVDMLRGAQLAQYIVRRQRMERDGRVSAHDELDWLGHYLIEGLHFDSVFGAPNAPMKYRLLSYTEQFDSWYFFASGVRATPTEKPRQELPPRLGALIARLENVRPAKWLLFALCLLNGDDQSRRHWDRMIAHVEERVASVGISDASQVLSNRVGISILRNAYSTSMEVADTATSYAKHKIAEVGASWWTALAEGVDRKLVVTLDGEGGEEGLCEYLVEPPAGNGHVVSPD